jgi:Tfp pilus assembly protein PilN
LRPVHVNLAARPYRDYRPVYAVVVVTSLLIAFLMLNNVDTYYRYVRDTKNTRTEIARIEAQIAQEHNRADAASRQIKTMDLVSLSRQSKFVNTQLAQRAFSWSELLDRLEAVLPGNVRVTSIGPRFDDNGLVHLGLSCEAKSADSMLIAINRFQKDPHFANPFPTGQEQTAAGYHFGLNVDYKPAVARVVVR